jgi:hypothetical protein
MCRFSTEEPFFSWFMEGKNTWSIAATDAEEIHVTEPQQINFLI